MTNSKKYKSEIHEAIHSTVAGMYRAGTIDKQTMRRFCLLYTSQCGDAERLKEAVGSLRKSIVIFPSSIASDLNSLLDWIEQAGSRSIVIQEHDTTLDPAIAKRIEGVVLRSVAPPQLVECLHRVAAGERSVQRASVKSMPSPDRVGVRVVERLSLIHI